MKNRQISEVTSSKTTLKSYKAANKSIVACLPMAINGYFQEMIFHNLDQIHSEHRMSVDRYYDMMKKMKKPAIQQDYNPEVIGFIENLLGAIRPFLEMYEIARYNFIPSTSIDILKTHELILSQYKGIDAYIIIFTCDDAKHSVCIKKDEKLNSWFILDAFQILRFTEANFEELLDQYKSATYNTMKFMRYRTIQNQSKRKRSQKYPKIKPVRVWYA